MKRLAGLALMLAALTPLESEARWSFGVAGFRSGDTVTPLAGQYTFADREQCERTLRALGAHGYLVFGTQPPAPAGEQAPFECWRNSASTENPGPTSPQ